MTGRPTKLNPEVQARIVRAIQLGATYELAANYGGIVYSAFRKWILRGEAEIERRQSLRVKEDTTQWRKEQPFVEFLAAVKSAEADGVVMWLAKIEKAASDGSWQAAAWKLERRYPELYGRRVQDTRHSGKDAGPIPIKIIEVVKEYEPEHGNGDAD